MSIFSNWRRLSLGVVACLCVAGFAAWRLGYLPAGGSGQAKDEKVERHGKHGQHEGDGPVPVTIAQARQQDVPVTIDAVGTVQALNTATIQTQVDGRLIKLLFNEGEDVRKGDIVAMIEPNLYQAAYDQAVAKKAQDEANLANARIDVVRYQKLAVSNYGSQQQYTTQKYLVAQLEAQVRQDQAQIDSAKTTLDYCTIRSPIDGRTGIRQVDVGNILHAADQTAIIVVTQLKPIYVFFTIPQERLPELQRAKAKGQPKVAALAGDNATIVEDGGEVSVIDNQIDQTTGTAKIKATFANQGLRLWPGKFVNVRVVVDQIKNAVTVPSPAVQRGPSGAFVYVMDENGAATLTNVTTGQQDENTAVVTQGLPPGAQVITTGFARLSDGAKVRVVTAQDDDASGRKTQDKGGSDGGHAWGGGGERRHRRDHAGEGAATSPPPAAAAQKK